MTTSLTVPVRTLVYTPFTGSEKDYAVDPRGRSARWRDNHNGFIGSIIADSHKANPARIVIPRQAGMLRTSLGKSWELDDYRFLDGEERGAYKSLGSVCEMFGITLAFVVGLNAPDGLPLDMAIPAHRACLRRVCERAREQGATELWVDTGGDIAIGKGGFGKGVWGACHIAAECGIVLIPEWTGNLPDDVLCPTYFRIRKKPTDPLRMPVVPAYGRPVFALTGTNGGGIETPEVNQRYADAGCTVVAWHENARKQALAPAGDADTTAKGAEA